MKTKSGFLSLLVCGLILAVFGVFVRVLNQYIGGLTQVGGRMAVATLIVLPYLLYKKISLKTSISNWPLFTIFILSFPLYIVFFTLSILNTKLVNAFFYLFASSMLTSFIMGYFYFKERINKENLVAAFLLLSGLCFLVYPFDFNQSWKGVLAGILGGIFWGVSNATRKFYTGKINNWAVIFYQMMTGAALSFFIAYFLNEFPHNQWILPSLSLLIIYGIGMVIIQTLLFIGFKNFPLNLGSIVLASQLFFVEFVGIFVFKEMPSLTELVGSLFVILAIIMSNLKIRS
ncbi:MAG: hypothetical protein US52_C0024G0005 [candidate division WS6 bacterium GW2011_GWA2_37_6]|uniref:EamA domain-containing protein n=1 Tax=candidate division WS6 bacterium GW2011_GWA2_37_6 TaxID=1619087 RepID=A0A0G0K4A1_9BACT|nr:MAG: hypothetical protein US52_C0024G0005 [candidate division WS6 bacterium GW2011_GWA2_37_6]